MAAEYLERMGARIAERRDALGLTQDEVARQMPGRVTGQRISLWERGKNRPRDDSLEALAGILGVPVSYFLASEPDKIKTPKLLDGVGGAAAELDGTVPERLARIEEKVDRLLTMIQDALFTQPADATQTPQPWLGELLTRIAEAPGSAHLLPSQPAPKKRRAAG